MKILLEKKFDIWPILIYRKRSVIGAIATTIGIISGIVTIFDSVKAKVDDAAKKKDDMTMNEILLNIQDTVGVTNAKIDVIQKSQ